MCVPKLPSELSRGRHQPSQLKPRPGILERVCFGLFIMAVVAIFKQLGITNAARWIG